MVAQENLQLLAVLRQVYKELQECKQAVADLSEHVQTYGAGGGNLQIVVQGEPSEDESDYEPSDMSDEEEDVQSCPF